MPADWTKGVFIRIPKKGALSDCNNWRGITLLSAQSKILAMIILTRISDALDAGMRKEEAGFWRERRCTDQIFTQRNTIEQCTEWQRQLYINFVDFEKAFDGIHRDSLWCILRAYGIPPLHHHNLQKLLPQPHLQCGKPKLPSQDRHVSRMCHVCSPF